MNNINRYLLAINYRIAKKYVKKKIKYPHYRPWRPVGDEDARVHIFAATTLGRGRVASPTLGCLYRRESPGTHFTGDWGGRRVIGISGSLIWSKILMELIFNPCGEFWWSPEGPVSQIHSPHLLVVAPGIFSDLLRFVQMLKREWAEESNGKLPYLFNLSNTAT